MSDYYYGDSLEALKLGAATASAIYRYCYNDETSTTYAPCSPSLTLQCVLP